jgi:hypothetical protein
MLDIQQSVWKGGNWKGGVWGDDGLPRKGLLFYSRTPNAWIDTGWEGEIGWESQLMGWVLPTSLHAVLGDGFWFTNSTTPIARTAAEILAEEGVNEDTFFAGDRGVAVYLPGSDEAKVAKIKKAIKAP